MEKIIANTIIEIVGAPIEHIKETMEKVSNLINENKNYEIIKKETSDPKESEFPHPSKKDEKIKVFSTFTEFEISFKDYDALTNFCFEFMPSSVEVLEPMELKIGAQEVNNTLNDILARLHHQSKIIMEYSALKKRIQQVAAKRASESQPTS
ncbi:hypothetical protein HON86_02875 [Candidatus Woesearchaeota archaeon]|jgi:hypothetical protein|nr:hypothetical protein [Candidatus Woesearchaeota archaeon]MBT4835536.1 hypothetical protein [Candidatus Woesearchaeota archaeon]MBT6735009.1 hypothetical protein [Candidatus Woesearchaeota archaeon]MBT7169917.1 hypothetical protein [Candidatus Woesearchaeota archaeon]MBT7474641.1 hypothetical protein [Candidatus Woesearchaeota archaeon]